MQSRRLRLITTEKCWYFSSDSWRALPREREHVARVLARPAAEPSTPTKRRVVPRAPDVVRRHAFDDQLRTGRRPAVRSSASTTGVRRKRIVRRPAGRPARASAAAPVRAAPRRPPPAPRSWPRESGPRSAARRPARSPGRARTDPELPPSVEQSWSTTSGLRLGHLSRRQPLLVVDVAENRLHQLLVGDPAVAGGISDHGDLLLGAAPATAASGIGGASA